VTRLVVSRNAENDMARILTYLEDEANAIVAEEFGRDVRRSLLRLIRFPGSGAPRPELGPDTRVVVVYPYLLIYDHSPPNLSLLRIIHGKANLTAEILMRPQP
jgi:plasmid stabilization system protein ParE